MTVAIIFVSVLCGEFLGMIAGVAIAAAKYEFDSQPSEIKLTIVKET